MATPIWFVEEFYLGSKLAQLQADSATASEWAGKTAADVKAAIEKVGMTTFDHFEMFHSAEGTSPNRPLKKSIFPVFTPKTCSPQQLA
jgi:hypothetical protein